MASRLFAGVVVETWAAQMEETAVWRSSRPDVEPKLGSLRSRLVRTVRADEGKPVEMAEMAQSAQKPVEP
jgi:hypothetical protein